MSTRYGERNPSSAKSDSNNNSPLKIIIIIAVIIIVIIFILVLLSSFSKNSKKHEKHGPHKLESFLAGTELKNHNEEEAFFNPPLTKSENKRPLVSHQKSCGCTQPCICEKKKEEKCGFCPQCPTCPSCPICPPICPEDCPECPLCPGGLGSNCTMNTQCASGFQCRGGICVCPKPPPPVNLTAVPIFDQTGPGFKLMITWSAVVNANFYDIIVFGPSSQHYINFVGTTVTTPILLPGGYQVFVFAGSNQCGTDQTSAKIFDIVIQPVPGGPCEINSQCPPNQVCFQGTCIDPVV